MKWYTIAFKVIYIIENSYFGLKFLGSPLKGKCRIHIHFETIQI